MARRSSWSSTTRMRLVMGNLRRLRRGRVAPCGRSRLGPRSNSTQMRPPCISTISLAIASPSPVPPLVLVLELSIWWNFSNTLSRSSGGMPGPVSLTATAKAAVRDAGHDAHLARVGELDGVADEVEQHLRQALLVAEAMRQALGDVRLERELLGLGQRLGRHPHCLDHAAERILGEVQAELAGLDLGDVEHGVDQPEQVLAVGLDARRGPAAPSSGSAP